MMKLSLQTIRELQQQQREVAEKIKALEQEQTELLGESETIDKLLSRVARKILDIVEAESTHAEGEGAHEQSKSDHIAETLREALRVSGEVASPKQVLAQLKIMKVDLNGVRNPCWLVATQLKRLSENEGDTGVSRLGHGKYKYARNLGD